MSGLPLWTLLPCGCHQLTDGTERICVYSREHFYLAAQGKDPHTPQGGLRLAIEDAFSKSKEWVTL